MTAGGRLQGRVALVTGAGRGIGEAIARRFAAEGASVVAAQRTVAEGEAVVASIAESGGTAASVVMDVREPESVAAAVAYTLERFGRLDVLCNNAGTGLNASLTETSAAEYDEINDVNARGVYLGMKYGIPPMLAGGGGSIVNMASVAALIGFPGEAAYSSSKGAVLMLTRQAALEYAADGIRVNAIAPGFVETATTGERFWNTRPDPAAARAAIVAVHPAGRLGTPHDVAGAALFLASDDSSWVTGTALTVDGGMTCQ
jgi:NAD(P)-dependent dehydrogenase (short-subunit alcohol dehydrogenase family)